MRTVKKRLHLHFCFEVLSLMAQSIPCISHTENQQRNEWTFLRGSRSQPYSTAHTKNGHLGQRFHFIDPKKDLRLNSLPSPRREDNDNHETCNQEEDNYEVPSHKRDKNTMTRLNSSARRYDLKVGETKEASTVLRLFLVRPPLLFSS